MKVWPKSSPSRIPALFVALVVVPSLLLVGLGWQLFQQDRAGLIQQAVLRRRQAAELSASILGQSVAALERSLLDSDKPNHVADHRDAAAIIVTEGRMTAASGSQVAFLPLPSPGRQVGSAAFEEIDQWRQSGAIARARSQYLHLSASPDTLIRAAALLRLAWDSPAAAKLDLYRRLAAIEDASFEGTPADLLARVSRCDVLNQIGNTTELRAEARAIYDDLLGGRWSISRAVYEANLKDVSAWAGREPQARPTSAEVFAGLAEDWWRASGAQLKSGHRLAPAADVTLFWTSQGNRLVLLLALRSFVERELIDPINAQMAKSNVRVALSDPLAQTIAQDQERKPAFETGLPWTIVAGDADAAVELARLNGRRRLWLAGLATLVVLLAAGSYLVTRSIARELVIARLQTDFVAAVSHEFRTPLTSMRQLTEILVDERVTSEDRRKAYYHALARQTDRLRRLVEGLLDFGRMEAGRSPYRLEPVDACALVRTVVEQFEQESGGQGARIDLEIEGDAWSVAGDSEALTNALWNLLDNAVKYSPGSRFVRVRVSGDAKRLLIQVRDEGIGIPPQEQDAIFDKFVRGTQAVAAGFKGTGIGLSMVRHIVQAHGGEILVQSAPGAGSTFTLALPIAKLDLGD